MKALTTTLATCALLMASIAVVHAQATINDCEKIQAADAYNQCLAKFGPPAKSGNLEPERPGDIKSSSADAAASAGRSPSRAHVRSAGRRHGRGTAYAARRGRGGGHSGRVAHGAHGSRKRLTITVGK